MTCGEGLEVARTIHLPGAVEREAPKERREVGLYLTTQEPPCLVFRSAAL